jgi:carbon-monoxide dehydrogenase large subunit
VSVDVTPDGFIEIFSATQAMGQGIQTSYAQLAVDVFGVPIEKVRIVQGDTDRGNGFGSAGLALALHRRLGGEGRRRDDRRALPRPSPRGARGGRGDIEYRAGRFSVVGTDLGIDLFALAGKQAEGGSTSTRRRRRAGRRGRTPATSARSRSIPTAARCRWSRTPRSTTSAGW